jgi:hypothetical protein
MHSRLPQWQQQQQQQQRGGGGGGGASVSHFRIQEAPHWIRGKWFKEEKEDLMLLLLLLLLLLPLRSVMLLLLLLLLPPPRSVAAFMFCCWTEGGDYSMQSIKRLLTSHSTAFARFTVTRSHAHTHTPSYQPHHDLEALLRGWSFASEEVPVRWWVGDKSDESTWT